MNAGDRPYSPLISAQVKAEGVIRDMVSVVAYLALEVGHATLDRNSKPQLRDAQGALDRAELKIAEIRAQMERLHPKSPEPARLGDEFDASRRAAL